MVHSAGSGFLINVSNSSLKYANDNKTCKRPGSQSCYPAAFVAITNPRCQVTFRLDSCELSVNSMSFGLCRKNFPNSSSDGFGKQKDSWGVLDNRNTSNRGDDAWVGFNKEKTGGCRKFKQGDLITLTVDSSDGKFSYTLNNGEYHHEWIIPGENFMENFYFGATFANDHEITITESPGSEIEQAIPPVVPWDEDMVISVSVGLCADVEEVKTEMPGLGSMSWAYQGEDGHCVTNAEGHTEFPSWSIGDTIGCGYDMSTRTIFFTRNGTMLGNGFHTTIPEGLKLKPHFGIKSQTFLCVKANFGEKAFVYHGPEVVFGPWATAAALGIESPSNRSVLHSIIGDISAIQLYVMKELMSYASRTDHSVKNSAALESRKRLLASPLFSNKFSSDALGGDPETDKQIKFLRKFIDDYEDKSVQKLVSIMRSKCLQDRVNAPPGVNHLVHMTCASLIWQHGLQAEALALAEGRRESDVTSRFLELWKAGQSMRDFLEEGDIQNSRESSSDGASDMTGETFLVILE